MAYCSAFHLQDHHYNHEYLSSGRSQRCSNPDVDVIIDNVSVFFSTPQYHCWIEIIIMQCETDAKIG